MSDIELIEPNDGILVPPKPEPQWVPKAGDQDCVFVDFKNEGLQWLGGRQVRCIRLVYQIAERKPNGRRAYVSRRFHRAIGGNSVLRRWLEAHRGRKFDLREQKVGLDLELMMNLPGIVTLEHQPWTEERVWVACVGIRPWDYGVRRLPLTPEAVQRLAGRSRYFPSTFFPRAVGRP